MIELETVAKVAAWIQHGLLAARVVVKVMLLDDPVPAIHDSRRYHNGRNYAGKKAQQHLDDSSSILAFCTNAYPCVGNPTLDFARRTNLIREILTKETERM